VRDVIAGNCRPSKSPFDCIFAGVEQPRMFLRKGDIHRTTVATCHAMSVVASRPTPTNGSMPAWRIPAVTPYGGTAVSPDGRTLPVGFTHKMGQAPHPALTILISGSSLKRMLGDRFQAAFD
jgi:hypothetical protein